MKRKLITTLILAVIIITAALAAGCRNIGGGEGTVKTDAETDYENPEKYSGEYSKVNGAFGGIDELGRRLSLDTGDRSQREDGSARKVGIFYFLWQGEHGTDGPYDNYKIASETPGAVISEQAWLAAGGGKVGAHHFWGQPMFGYYTSKDTWVMRKHLQMLTDAGVDFIVFDTTNAITYTDRVKQLISIWYGYLEKGVDVPKLAFYTNSSSGDTINRIYKEIYTDKSLNSRYPRLSELWYMWDGKPMIVGDPGDPALSDAAKEYFRIKSAVWPNAERTDDGFPWMEFDRSLTDKAVYGLNGRREVVNVSVAQNSATCVMSATAWYGANDRTRSWHNGKNDTSEDSVLYGYNFAEQWEWALKVDPEMVFVTGWNEWVAQRQPATAQYPVFFVDCCDPATSRDVEPMEGLFGDNYYMQMVEYIRRYKGSAPRVDVGELQTIDVEGGFEQWDAASVTARYTDYTGDAVSRNTVGFGGIKYKTDSGINDLADLRAARDRENLYFYAETVRNIQLTGEDGLMTLFISSGRTDTEKWAQCFDFAVGLEPPENGCAVLSALHADGSSTRIGLCRMKVEGKQMMLEVPRELLGIPYMGGHGLVDVQFKWADGCQMKDGLLDVWSFYKNGDAAPMGRFTYVFSEKSTVLT